MIVLGCSGPFFQASGKGIKDWELAVLSYLVRLGWDMELDLKALWCLAWVSALHGAWRVRRHSVSLHCYNKTFCAALQDRHWLRNHLFHNSSHKPLFNFLSHFLVGFGGSLLAQHGALAWGMLFCIRGNKLSMTPVTVIEECLKCGAWGSISGIFVRVMTWFQHVVTK